MPTNDRDTGEPNESGALQTILSDLFETIVDMDEQNQRRQTGTGTVHGDNTQFDFGFSVTIGSQAGWGETHETQSVSADTDHATTIHSTNEGYVVTVDLPDVDPPELSAGVDTNHETLSIAVDGDMIERVALPQSSLEVSDESFNNGVLDIQLRSQEESG